MVSNLPLEAGFLSMLWIWYLLISSFGHSSYVVTMPCFSLFRSWWQYLSSFGFGSYCLSQTILWKFLRIGNVHEAHEFFLFSPDFEQFRVSVNLLLFQVSRHYWRGSSFESKPSHVSLEPYYHFVVCQHSLQCVIFQHCFRSCSVFKVLSLSRTTWRSQQNVYCSIRKLVHFLISYYLFCASIWAFHHNFQPVIFLTGIITLQYFWLYLEAMPQWAIFCSEQPLMNFLPLAG